LKSEADLTVSVTIIPVRSQSIRKWFKAQGSAIFFFCALLVFLGFSASVIAQVPDLSRYSFAERQAMENACSRDRIMNGAAAYGKCLQFQISEYRLGPSIPDLSRYGFAERQAMENACSRDRVMNGAAAYGKCLQFQISEYRLGPSIPDLSRYSFAERQAMENACSRDRVMNGVAAYGKCLQSQIAEYASANSTETTRAPLDTIRTARPVQPGPSSGDLTFSSVIDSPHKAEQDEGLSRLEYDALYDIYSRSAREESELPECPKGPDDVWINCFGTINFPDGSRYTGEIGNLSDLPIAANVPLSSVGISYPTDIRGTRTGIGVYESVGTKAFDLVLDRYIFFGQWLGGKRYGFGRLHLADGGRYVGFHRLGYRHGEGVEFEADGRIKNQGRWSNDRLASVYSLDSSRYTFGGDLLLPRHITLDRSVRPFKLVHSFTASAEMTKNGSERVKTKGALKVRVIASRPDSAGSLTLTIVTNTDTLSLKINGDEQGHSADGRYLVRRFARLGENKFEVVARDRSGNNATQVISVVREPVDTTVRFATLNPGALRAKPATNAVAIIIGIQDYRRVPKADFANNDARVFYDYAIRGLGVRPENVKLLVDQQADDVEILSALKNWLPLKAKRGQTDIYVFYSGHGLPSDDGASLYFLPHGVDRQFLDRTAIKQAEVVSALQAVSPKSVTLFLDACYSGQSRGGETLLASARPISIQPKASKFPSNFTVLSASAPEQIASSSPDLKHGIFSYFLMKGMEGEADQNKDGSITVQEMQAYLSDSVGRKAMSLNRTQQPQLAGDKNRVLVNR
jgi:hypothetical protein